MTIPEIEVLFNDEHLVVVNKPPGISVHGRNSDDPTCLMAAVAAQLGISQRLLHPASRLDLPVSGVIAIAKSARGRRSLTKQYQHREVSRRYIALVAGILTPPQGSWDAPIGVDRRDRRRRVIHGYEQRPAETEYRVIWTADETWSFVELTPRTGRTHQLRVHLSQVAKCPIAGDRRYGGPTTIGLENGAILAVPRVMLHAERLSLKHPESDVPMKVEATMYSDFEEIITRLKVS